MKANAIMLLAAAALLFSASAFAWDYAIPEIICPSPKEAMTIGEAAIALRDLDPGLQAYEGTSVDPCRRQPCKYKVNGNSDGDAFGLALAKIKMGRTFLANIAKNINAEVDAAKMAADLKPAKDDVAAGRLAAQALTFEHEKYAVTVDAILAHLNKDSGRDRLCYPKNGEISVEVRKAREDDNNEIRKVLLRLADFQPAVDEFNAAATRLMEKANSFGN